MPAFLSNLFRHFRADRIAALNEKRRATSRMVSSGEYLDGNRRVPVALSMTQSTFVYENGDMQSSLELQWVNEVEYDTRLSTGLAVEGVKVLRRRCYSRTYEFVIPNDVVPRWHMMLPPRRSVEYGTLAMPAPVVAKAS